MLKLAHFPSVQRHRIKRLWSETLFGLILYCAVWYVGLTVILPDIVLELTGILLTLSTLILSVPLSRSLTVVSATRIVPTIESHADARGCDHTRAETDFWIDKGKALARNFVPLQEIARQYSLPDPLEWFAADVMFPPEEAVKAFQKLVVVIEEHRQRFEDMDNLRSDLIALTAVLREAEKCQVRFKLTVWD